MREIFVYGDSYASSENDGCPAWADMVADKLQMFLYNQAISGSSTEYAIKSFIKDVNEGLIGDKDIIIFVTSTPGRMHFQFQNSRPETAAPYWHHVDVKDPKHAWYKENKHFIEWYLLNFDCKLNSINHEGYLHILKNFAEANPECTVIVLANSDHNFLGNVKMPFGNIPENFLKPDIFLNLISQNEIVGKEEYNTWVKHTGWDPRVNHLSNPNLEMLSKLIIKTIHTKSIKHFGYDKFKTGILEHIDSKTKYTNYINQNILYNLPGIANNLPG